MRQLLLIAAYALPLAGCAADRQTAGADMSAALSAASFAESIYAQQAKADPKVVQTLTHLLAAAQAAVQTWQSSSLPADQAAAAAAVAALVEFESASGVAL